MNAARPSATRVVFRVIIMLIPVLVIHALVLFQWFYLKEDSLTNEKWDGFYKYADSNDWFGYHFAALLMIIVSKSIIQYLDAAAVFIKTGKFPRADSSSATESKDDDS